MKKRIAAYPIAPLFIERWSPRALSKELLSDEELMVLFEAARWAPSSYNNQPWRFIYAKRTTAYWDILFNLLVEANQVWAKNAAVLLVICSSNVFSFNNKPARTHSFDTGAAWENLTLQGHLNNIIVHGMQGFDYERAQKELKIPDNYTVEAMAALGKKGEKESLPIELQQKEEPSDRNPLEKFVFEGFFKKE